MELEEDADAERDVRSWGRDKEGGYLREED